jgi:hypothetical protein
VINKKVIPYATEQDIENSKITVKEEIEKHNINMTEEDLEKLTEYVMWISYAKGGAYSTEEIKSYAEIFVGDELYKEVIKKSGQRDGANDHK